MSICPVSRLSGAHSCRFQHHHLLVRFLLHPALALGGIAKSHQLEVQGGSSLCGVLVFKAACTPGDKEYSQPVRLCAAFRARKWKQSRTLAMWCWVAVPCMQACSRLCRSHEWGLEFHRVLPTLCTTLTGARGEEENAVLSTFCFKASAHKLMSNRASGFSINEFLRPPYWSAPQCLCPLLAAVLQKGAEVSQLHTRAQASRPKAGCPAPAALMGSEPSWALPRAVSQACQFLTLRQDEEAGLATVHYLEFSCNFPILGGRCWLWSHFWGPLPAPQQSGQTYPVT